MCIRDRVLRALLVSALAYFALDVIRRSSAPSAATRDQINSLLSLSSGELFDPAGKNVIVTGASSGIGEALAYRYASLGANVGLVARRNGTLQEVKARCDALKGGGVISTLSADVADAKGWSQVEAYVEGLSLIHI
eukprot:TRINITY_DN15255_c0_g1_i1.p1 TRINITY_DN15255_c0_g1~~TRINITY_DN15255_c0_g1_i1.p1  ORF type:complete len:136 (-),score=31.06 TRINITY_DN15255_c0_g1_i1:2-409(-)